MSSPRSCALPRLAWWDRLPSPGPFQLLDTITASACIDTGRGANRNRAKYSRVPSALLWASAPPADHACGRFRSWAAPARAPCCTLVSLVPRRAAPRPALLAALVAVCNGRREPVGPPWDHEPDPCRACRGTADPWEWLGYNHCFEGSKVWAFLDPSAAAGVDARVGAYRLESNAWEGGALNFSAGWQACPAPRCPSPLATLLPTVPSTVGPPRYRSPYHPPERCLSRDVSGEATAERQPPRILCAAPRRLRRAAHRPLRVSRARDLQSFRWFPELH
jgi:hypothetical protein